MFVLYYCVQMYKFYISLLQTICHDTKLTNGVAMVISESTNHLDDNSIEDHLHVNSHHGNHVDINSKAVTDTLHASSDSYSSSNTEVQQS